MNDPQDIELIVRIYEGTASAADQALFAQKVAADPAFRSAAEQHREAVEAMERLARRDELKKMLQREDEHLGPLKSPPPSSGQKTKRRWGNWRMISLLATAAAFAGLLYWFRWNTGQSPDAQELFARYFHPERLASVQRSGETMPVNEFGRYLAHFDRQQYDSCTALFPLLPDSVKTWRKVQLRQSVVLLHAGESAAAVEILQNLVAQNSPEYQDARWLLALARLQMNNIEACRTLLTSIADTPASAFQNDARELLKQLELPKR